jgi:hypothetical protein
VIEKRALDKNPGDRVVSDILRADGRWFNLNTRNYEDEFSPAEELRRLMQQKGLNAVDIQRLLEGNGGLLTNNTEARPEERHEFQNSCRSTELPRRYRKHITSFKRQLN